MQRTDIRNSKKTNHVSDALRPVQSDVFHCRENIHFVLSLDLLHNIEGHTEQPTSFCTIPEMTEIVTNSTSGVCWFC